MVYLVAIVYELPKIMGVFIGGVLMIGWLFPDFFDFVRDVMGKNQPSYQYLEEKIERLESQLKAVEEIKLFSQNPRGGTQQKVSHH